MKEKFASLKKLNVGTVMSASQQRNVLGGYSYENIIYCYQNNYWLGTLQGGRVSPNPLGNCKSVWSSATYAYQTVIQVD